MGVNDKVDATGYVAPDLCFDVELLTPNGLRMQSNIVDGWAISRDVQVGSMFHVLHYESRCKANMAALNIDDAVSLRAAYIDILGHDFVFDGKGTQSSREAQLVFQKWAYAIPGRSDRVLFVNTELPEEPE